MPISLPRFPNHLSQPPRYPPSLQRRRRTHAHRSRRARRTHTRRSRNIDHHARIPQPRHGIKLTIDTLKHHQILPTGNISQPQHRLNHAIDRVQPTAHPGRRPPPTDLQILAPPTSIARPPPIPARAAVGAGVPVPAEEQVVGGQGRDGGEDGLPGDKAGAAGGEGGDAQGLGEERVDAVGVEGEVAGEDAGCGGVEGGGRGGAEEGGCAEGEKD
jgi:hypothetical protein